MEFKKKENSMNRNIKAYQDLPYNVQLKGRAAELRKAGNLSEVLLWRQIKSGQINGWDFDRQKIIGDYIVDFYCANCRTVIEIDGESHDYKGEYDERRDAYLKKLGLNVIHIDDKEIKRNLDGVIEMLKCYLSEKEIE
ncbi:MAG: endonuclease domain-containing protein [Clostridiales bacterium]|nr:endonuclease domain-containing protein [Clostridiales bacterium]